MHLKRCAYIAFGLSHSVLAQQQQQPILSNGVEATSPPVNVAIIGGGPAGASAAYHLAKYSAASGASFNITIIERESRIGGRSTTVNAHDDPRFPVELGASIFVKVNRILVDATEDFNLSSFGIKSANAQAPGPELAVWDGERFVFVQYSGSTWWNIAKMLWRYGLAPMRTINLMKSTVAKFLKMYDEPIFPFESLTQAAQVVGLLDVTTSTGEQYLKDHSVSGDFAHDIVQASTRVNYGQNLKYIDALTSNVCMATEGAMSIEGGNWQIFDNMVSASNSTKLLNTEVKNVERQKNGSYVLGFDAAYGKASDSLTHQSFDSVIMAAPYQFANVTFKNALQHIPDSIPYVKLHVTLFTSPHLPSPAFFNLPPDQSVAKTVLTTLPKDEEPGKGSKSCGSPGFFSISRLDTIANPTNGQTEYTYKIFSPKPIDHRFLSKLLGIKHDDESATVTADEKDVTWVYRKVWHSYPYEYPRVTFEEIKLDDGFYYTSGMESFISTMETSALAGKNVARLLHDQWKMTKVEFTPQPWDFTTRIG